MTALGTAPDPDSPLSAASATAFEQTAAYWDDVQPSKALDATWSLIRATNGHLEVNEPWKAEPGPNVDRVMGDALEALRIVAILCFPAIPDTAQAVWERIGMPGNVGRSAAARQPPRGASTHPVPPSPRASHCSPA